MNKERYCYGEDSRFFIFQFTGRNGRDVYMVRDASWILDSEIYAGYISPIVAQFDTPEEAEEWCDQVYDGVYFTVPHESQFVGWPELRQRVYEFLKHELRRSLH